MKGLTTAEIIGIILAVIAVIVAIYIMWVKGWIPFLSPVDESTCRTNLIKACEGTIKWDGRELEGDNIKFFRKCLKFYSDIQKTYLENCLEDPQNQCDAFCATLY
ncbi:MAG: hypothetical protein QXG39_00905 [Candidatus Aenigmatarchaeota archaeon]